MAVTRRSSASLSRRKRWPSAMTTLSWSACFLFSAISCVQPPDLGREDPPISAYDEQQAQDGHAEEHAQVEIGNGEGLLGRRWREVDADHTFLSPARRSPSPTPTASSGPACSSSSAENLPASCPTRSSGRAISTGTPHEEERNSSIPARCAQPPDSTMRPMRSDSAVEAK